MPEYRLHYVMPNTLEQHFYYVLEPQFAYSLHKFCTTLLYSNSDSIFIKRQVVHYLDFSFQTKMRNIIQHRALRIASRSTLRPSPFLFLRANSNPKASPLVQAPPAYIRYHRNFTTSITSNMSFSNADTGSKPADPYKAKAKDETATKQKVEDLVAFIDKCKFGMMTTRIASSGLLVSRCMALAGKVDTPLSAMNLTVAKDGRKAAVSTSPSTPTPSLARPTT
jgi:hypothetical protein